MLLEFVLSLSYADFTNEDYPNGKGLLYNIGSDSAQYIQSPDSGEAPCCYKNIYFRGSFCPTETGQYHLVFNLEYSTRFAFAPTSEMCMTVDGAAEKCTSRKGDGEISLDYYLYKGKCYKFYATRYAGDATAARNNFYLTINDQKEEPITSFSQNYAEACMVPKTGPKRLGARCQDWTTIYCNNHGTETNGIDVSVGDEKCICSNTDSDVFCEPNTYLPFGEHSGKLVPTIYETWTNLKAIRTDPSISLSSNVFTVPDDDIYSKIVYSGFIYLPQKGDYTIRVISRLEANLQIDTYNDFGNTNFLECQHQSKTKKVIEVKVTAESAKTIKPFYLSVFTQCAFIDDREITIEWMNNREAYVKGISPTYESLPTKYLTDDQNAFIDP